MQSDLHAIAAAFGPGVGENLLARLTRSLAELLPAEHVFIGRLGGNSKNRIEMIAYCERGEMAPNRTYMLANTPCENVIGTNQQCVFDPEVWRLFPMDRMLVEMRAQTYIDSPLRQSIGSVAGLISLCSIPPTPA